MIKKIFCVFALVLSFLGISHVEANNESNFMDIQTYTSIYKLSEDSEVKLPYIKFFNEKASFDKKLDKSGLTIAAKAVEIADDINGMQTIIASDTVDIKGNMEYATIIASNVGISGTIEKDSLIIAESVFITETANILGDIVIMAGSVEMRGNVQGNIIANSSEFLMEGNVEKDFRVRSENMTFNETDIKGDIYIETESDLDISNKYQNAIVNKIERNAINEVERKAQITKTVVSVITAVILFTLLNKIVRKIKPELFKTLADKAAKHSSFAVIMGVLLLTTIPIVVLVVLVCSTFGLGVVTTPLFVVYIAMLVVVIALAKFIVGSVVYELIKEKLKIDTSLKEIGMLMGIFATLYLLCYIPYIAWFATMAIVLISAGITVTGMIRK